ncbi:hypothetical protein EV359DRAFT_82316 [Lentinula novae-zelandiae]|nr:hypothetical protein EV359DRAFT_82316 [Lentinula novae-zelandiae]
MPHIPSPPPLSVEMEENENWLRSIVSEKDIRLETLYDSETHLEFINHPSPNLSFVSLDPETLLHVNSGDFSLKTTSNRNMRFLETEARLCGLLKQIQALPPAVRSIGELDVENELYTALDKIHRFKGRQWKLQAYPNGIGGMTVNNTRHFTAHKPNPDIAPIFIAALIIYIKFQTPVHQMRVILALLRCIIRALKRNLVDSHC